MARSATTTAARRTGSGKSAGGARRRTGGAAANGSGTVKKAAGKAAKTTAKKAVKGAVTPGDGPVKSVARTAVRKGAKAIARRAAESGAELLRRLADETADAGRRAMEAGMSRRLPIQVSIDVAVPIAFAWEEWMRFESLTEGVDRVEDVERDGDTLFGRVAGPRSRDWEAEVLDERELESFAWRSVAGSDCAGLVTFHALAERLTRIELDLDVLPTGPVQTLAFASHLAHRRAETELRRFKARLEFINPDVYASEDDEAPEEDDEGEDGDAGREAPEADEGEPESEEPEGAESDDQ